MEAAQAFGEGIVFQFIDTVRAGNFGRTTEAGIYIPPSHTEAVDQTHEANVISVGSKVRYVKPGDQVIIDNLKWTEMFKVDGDQYWKTDESHIFAIRT
jgi:co-chaperonin GroES (HSP10)